MNHQAVSFVENEPYYLIASRNLLKGTKSEGNLFKTYDSKSMSYLIEKDLKRQNSFQ